MCEVNRNFLKGGPGGMARGHPGAPFHELGPVINYRPIISPLLFTFLPTKEVPGTPGRVAYRFPANRRIWGSGRNCVFDIFWVIMIYICIL